MLERGRILGVATTDSSRPVALSTEDSLRHLHLIGPTGVGKSTLMANLALQDIAAGRGVVVIDPKGDLVDGILARTDASRLDDVVVLDARDESPVGINGLADPRDPDLAADAAARRLPLPLRRRLGPADPRHPARLLADAGASR